LKIQDYVPKNRNSKLRLSFETKQKSKFLKENFERIKMHQQKITPKRKNFDFRPKLFDQKISFFSILITKTENENF